MEASVIRVYEPVFGEPEAENLALAIRSGWISQGPFVERFEREWASYCGRKHGIACSNGTAALEMAVRALDLEPGDEVILPAFTMIACPLAVLRAGAVPVLVDSDWRSWNIDSDLIEEKITPRTKAIMPVHIYGSPAHMHNLALIARKRGLAVIEDAAEAHGAECLFSPVNEPVSWKKCGGMGDMGCFSFYSNKPVACGEGGMVVTDDGGLAERMRGLRSLCLRFGKEFREGETGSNWKMSDLQAAVGCAQVARLDETLARKRWIAGEYRTGLARVTHKLSLPYHQAWARPIWWMYAVLLADYIPATNESLGARLAAEGIETRPFFRAIHEHPVFRDAGLFAGERYPVAERLSRKGLYLPSGLKLTAGQIALVCARVEEALEGPIL